MICLVLIFVAVWLYRRNAESLRADILSKIGVIGLVVVLVAICIVGILYAGADSDHSAALRILDYCRDTGCDSSQIVNAYADLARYETEMDYLGTILWVLVVL